MYTVVYELYFSNNCFCVDLQEGLIKKKGIIMNKIALFTWFKNGNYGTILQAYALMRILGNFHDCEIINYKSNSKHRFKDLFNKHSRKRLIVRVEEKLAATFFKKSYLLPYQEKIKKFEEFIDKKLKLSNQYLTKVDLRDLHYKYYVCGSDQIWNPCHFDPVFFLDFVDEGKKIAYAPSFGVESLDEYPDERNAIKKYLASFEYISVREETGKRFVKQLLGKDVPLCLDPTLLISKNEWEQLAAESSYKFPQKFMYCLFLGNSKQYIRKAKKIANILGLQCYIHSYNLADYFGGNYKFKSLSPVDFVSAIKKASFVCTDSFHVTVFAILFHKPFICYKRFKEKEKFSQNSRIENLLRLTGLLARLDLESIDVNELLNIDYKPSDEMINTMRRQSFNYLAEALDKEEN